ncbi:ankyrin repeat domain-containing protein [Solirubrobacter soli]|uniref:ankyrin repeat domain-containing protein n=1 Tax=Solirubrobacter soli TaxID=363832 RepID=UPI0012F74916|nr:ankyrin repeat domain-containing protein [Solirubrobacter soli]
MDDFVRAATNGRRARAEALWRETDDQWARLVHGDGFEGDANAPGGPLGWAPLLYVTHSVFANVAPARELLARGADPNATFTNEYGEMSALYGAAGRAHDPELTRLLLDAGANPDDGESVYHATEAESADCLRALLEHGATAEPIMLAHALDDDRPEHVRLLLEAGADPRELLPHAVRRGRGPEAIRVLAAHGADLEHLGGEIWRRPERLRTAYQHAVLRGFDEVAAALEALGARTDVDFDDLAIAAIARGERPPVIPREHDWDQLEALARADTLGLVVELYGPDFKGVIGGSPLASLISIAAWLGDVERVRFLLAAGAKPDGLWAAVHGSGSIGVAELLVAAGERIEPAYLEDADSPLYEWLAANRP